MIMSMQMEKRPRILWNGEVKRLVFSFVFILAAAVLAGNLGVNAYKDSQRRESNAFFATVLGNVAVLYPDVDETRLIRQLNDSSNQETGERLMAQYGIFMGDRSFAGLERQLTLLQTGANIFIVFFAAGMGLLLFLNLFRRHEKVQSLTAYMEALNRDSYSLRIEDNDDDELSSLRNEIYKLTVLLKEQAGRAADQKKALADSVANISHQLKTPLTSIRVLVDNLTENADMDEGIRRRFMGEVSRQLSGMSWLVDTMLKLSRLEAGVVVLNRQKCFMEELMGTVLQKLETVAELAEVTICTELQKGVFLWIDKNWTVEALVNILKNAMEHSPAGGRIEVYGADNDVYAELRITDHGTGITEEEKQRLFERFYRGNTAGEDSTGIGLALSKEIVERQNGHISVDSELQRGTVFSIKFLK